MYETEVTYNGLLFQTSICQLLLLPIIIITYFISYVPFLTGKVGRRYFTRVNVRKEHVYCVKAININNYTACIS